MDLDDLQARLGSDLVRLSAGGAVPGMSVAVLSGTYVVAASVGVTNTRTGVPVTCDTLFQIQSVTKLFTATMVLQLVDEGLLQLDDPVQAHLPEFRTADLAASHHITVRHLLTHSGGFEGDLWGPSTSGPDALDRFVRDLVSLVPQHSRPGDRFSYCNAGYGVLGRLVEVVHGATYEQALRTQLAEPLGVDELAFSADQALAFRTAIGHVRPSPSDPLRPTRRWAAFPPSNPAAGNQLAMSARGLLALGRLFLSGGRAPDGTQVLSEASVHGMLRRQLPHSPGRGASFQGLGWHLTRPGVAEHTGGAPGVAAILRIAPERGVAAVVLTNSDDGAPLMLELLDALFAELAGVDPAPPVRVPDPGLRVPDAAPFLGRYATRQAFFDVSQDREARLWISSEPRNEAVTIAHEAGVPAVGDRYELRHLEGDSFVRIGGGEKPRGTITFFGRHDGLFTRFTDGRTASRTSQHQIAPSLQK